ncbi:plastocyanin/azurin family copper-binding protein [Profundibacterium mesophilum]|nr:plastocyanin/azurin family copper-binding protein [Profundibacterium mesophilum]
MTGALLAAITLLGACGLTGPANTAAPRAADDAIVEMTNDLQFAPAVLTISAGSTVAFSNGSLLDHTVHGNPVAAAHPQDVALPEGAAPFQARVPAGQIYRHAFNTPGTYRYYCDPHHGLGMKGTIIVTAR